MPPPLVSLFIFAIFLACLPLIESIEASALKLEYNVVSTSTIFAVPREAMEPAVTAGDARRVTKLIAASIPVIWDDIQSIQTNQNECLEENLIINCFGGPLCHGRDSEKVREKFMLCNLLLAESSFNVDVTIQLRVHASIASKCEISSSITVLMVPILSGGKDIGVNENLREVLIRAVDNINKIFGVATNNVEATWRICANPSPHASLLSRVSSIEDQVLSNDQIFNKVRLASVRSQAITPHSTQVWSYVQPESSTPTVALFVDDSMQLISTSASKARAEAFIHPTLLAHPNPTRVAVFSSNPLAYVKEILKHTTIEKIDLVGVDRVALGLACEFLPSYNNCSAFEGLGERCLDNEAVSIANVSSTEWIRNMSLLENAMGDTISEYDDEEQYAHFPWFDAIFVDDRSMETLDYLRTLSSILDEDGVLVLNMGYAPSLDNSESMLEADRSQILRQLTRGRDHDGLGMAIAHVYDEPLASPLPSAFILALPSYGETYQRFFQKNPTAIDLAMISRFRSLETTSTQSLPTVLYDGPTHSRYTRPSRAWESWYCNTVPGSNLYGCKVFLPKIYDRSYHSSKTEVRRHPVKGNSLYAVEDIAEGTFINPEDAVLSLFLDGIEWQALNRFVRTHPETTRYKDLRDLFLVYGYEDNVLGQTGWAVSLASKNTFTNHACSELEANTAYPKALFQSEDDNVKDDDDDDDDEDDEEEEDTESIGFSPLITRRVEMSGVLAITTRKIKKGEEIMIDYRSFRDDMKDHPEFEEFICKMCNDGIGLVPTTEEGAGDAIKLLGSQISVEEGV